MMVLGHRTKAKAKPRHRTKVNSPGVGSPPTQHKQSPSHLAFATNTAQPNPTRNWSVPTRNRIQRFKGLYTSKYHTGWAEANPSIRRDQTEPDQPDSTEPNPTEHATNLPTPTSANLNTILYRVWCRVNATQTKTIQRTPLYATQHTPRTTQTNITLTVTLHATDSSLSNLSNIAHSSLSGHQPMCRFNSTQHVNQVCRLYNTHK